MKLKTMLRLAGIVAVTATLIVGCSSDKKEGTPSIDPPPVGAEAMMGGTDIPVIALEDARQVTLFLKDPAGLVAPVTVLVPKTVEVARKSLEYMVKGGPGEEQFPYGFEGLLPEGTIVQGIDIKPDSKLAVVDFSQEFNHYDQRDERKLLEAVVWTLTQFETIDKVSIRVNGYELEQMTAANTPVNSDMGRSMGINLEFTAGMNVGQAVPVTLYFLNQTIDQYSYYVPVTRMVERTDDIAKAVVDQLIKGPDSSKGLASVLTPDVGLVQVNLSQDLGTVIVNFDDKLLGSDNLVPASAANAIILSLTESTGASQVQLMVNGDTQVTGTDNMSYAQPVSAPSYINPSNM